MYNPKTLLEIYFVEIHFSTFLLKNPFKIKYEFLYRTSLNTWVLLMIFNEILIPQDSFTETNVTRKKSIVGNSQLHSQNHFIQNFIFCFYFIFSLFLCLWKTWKIIIKPHTIPKWCIKIKMLEKRYQNNSYQNTNRNDN